MTQVKLKPVFKFKHKVVCIVNRADYPGKVETTTHGENGTPTPYTTALLAIKATLKPTEMMISVHYTNAETAVIGKEIECTVDDKMNVSFGDSYAVSQANQLTYKTNVATGLTNNYLLVASNPNASLLSVEEKMALAQVLGNQLKANRSRVVTRTSAPTIPAFSAQNEPVDFGG